MNFNEQLKEFIEETNLEKFTDCSEVKFSDGTYMGEWFIKHKKQLARMDNLVVSILADQFKDYKSLKVINFEEKKYNSFNKKVKEFINENNLNKFNGHSNVKFGDGMNMGTWFYYNKKKLLKIDQSLSKDIFKQFKEYKDSIIKLNKEKFNKRIIEFANEQDLNKFKSMGELKFKDGVRMGKWFSYNKNKLMEMNNDLSILIINEYEKYKEYMEKEALQNKKKIFDQKLMEFAVEKDFGKFKYCGNVRFKDGSFMWSWFLYNKEFIISSSDELSLKIKKDYFEYKNLNSNNNFYSEEDSFLKMI